MKTINEKHISKEKSEEYEKLAHDNLDKWEKGDYGRNKNYMARASPEEEKKLNVALGLPKKKKQKNYSIKFDEELIQKVKFVASRKHIGYQTLIKIVIADYLEKNWKNVA